MLHAPTTARLPGFVPTLLAAFGFAAAFGLAGAPAALAQTCVDSPEGLLGWWPGDGTPDDLDGGPDARLAGGAGYGAGLVGDAFALDGVTGARDGRVVFSRSSIDGLADFTLEFWVRTTDERGSIVSAANGNPSSANEILMIQTTAGLAVWLKQQGSGLLPVFLNDGAWHHVAMVRKGILGELWVDGVMADARSFPEGLLDVGPRGFLLGQDQDCLGGCFDGDQALDGLVDEVAIYGRALAASEIAAVVAAGAEGRCKPAPPAPAPGPAPDPVTAARVEALEAEVLVLDGRIVELEDQVDALESAVDVPDKHRKAWEKRRQAWQRWVEKHRDHDDEDEDDRKERRRRGKR